MTEREKTILLFKDYLKTPNRPHSVMVDKYKTLFELNQEVSVSSVVGVFLEIMDGYRTNIDHLTVKSSQPTSFQISADTEEGKQLIKNLMEMYKKKEE